MPFVTIITYAIIIIVYDIDIVVKGQIHIQINHDNKHYYRNHVNIVVVLRLTAGSVLALRNSHFVILTNRSPAHLECSYHLFMRILRF